MKENILLILIAIMTTLLGATAGVSETVDQIMAVVNGEPITFSMIEDMMNAVWLAPPALPKSKDEALQKLIDHKLELREARRRGIFVSEDELSNALAVIVSQFESPTEFNKILKQKGIAQADLQSYVIEEIMVQKMIGRTFGLFVKNSDIEGDAVLFFEQNRDKFVMPESVLLDTILFKVDSDGKNKEEIRKKAEAVLNKIKEEKDFESYSNSNGKASYVRVDKLSPIEASAISQLQIGDISNIIELPIGFFIIKLKDRIPSRQISYSEKKEEIESFLRQKKIDEQLKAWLEKQRKTADIRLNNVEKI